MAEPESPGHGENECNVTTADVRFARCMDWLATQNSEGSRKLSQQNKNDIQFIIQTNADRKKFLLSAAEDEATVPAGVDESSVEPKALPIHRLRKELNVECEWLSCNWSFTDYELFQKHCRNHISDLKMTNKDDKVFYTCLWDSCNHSTSDFEEMVRHVNYHAYHARLLSIGFNGRATLNLAQCKKDSRNRNKLPILKSDFCCMWTGCEEKFSAIQAFLDHVKVHINSTSKPVCSWAGCGAVFPRRVLLCMHVRSHSGERLIACYHCGTHFAANRKLCDHLRRQNVINNEHTCTVCGASHATDYLLRQHARQHISQHACTLCDMSAPTLAALALHIRYRHTSPDCRMHACPHCTYKAVTNSDLRKHLITHNRKPKPKKRRRSQDSDVSEESSEEEVKRKKKKEAKKYACHMCPEKEMKVFPNGARLTQHLVKVHGAQWPFGHSRFRYQISEDGMYRLTTTRYEILEVSKKIVDGYSGPKDSISNQFEFDIKQKAKATETTPTCIEITLKNSQEDSKEMPVKSEPSVKDNAVEITMCDVDEEGNIICSEIIKSDVVYT